jgi:hypothetical protein
MHVVHGDAVFRPPEVLSHNALYRALFHEELEENIARAVGIAVGYIATLGGT